MTSLASNPQLLQNLERIADGKKPVVVSQMPRPKFELNTIIDSNLDGFSHLVNVDFR